jgi:hypothetical protein
MIRSAGVIIGARSLIIRLIIYYNIRALEKHMIRKIFEPYNNCSLGKARNNCSKHMYLANFVTLTGLDRRGSGLSCDVKPYVHFDGQSEGQNPKVFQPPGHQ